MTATNLCAEFLPHSGQALNLIGWCSDLCDLENAFIPTEPSLKWGTIFRQVWVSVKFGQGMFMFIKSFAKDTAEWEFSWMPGIITTLKTATSSYQGVKLFPFKHWLSLYISFFFSHKHFRGKKEAGNFALQPKTNSCTLGGVIYL